MMGGGSSVLWLAGEVAGRGGSSVGESGSGGARGTSKVVYLVTVMDDSIEGGKDIHPNGAVKTWNFLEDKEGKLALLVLSLQV